ncbi:glycosyltransferase family 39 protein [Halomarina pelagica]|uniref:glycosyltransferase family 39 protein n=1 Tax=Halomarina pelagica TaxID=2961599 RepID=UPI0020C2EEBD|nr:glycosyltransferase family 39 protein [Halomarina sp. BND7]
MSERVVRASRTQVALALVVLVGAAVRLYGLGIESLWTDELITLEYIRRYGALELFVVIPLNQPHLPLYYVLLDLWASVFGLSAVALRSFSALFGIATIPLFYLVGRELFDDVAGLVAALVYALAQVQVYHAQEVRMYTLLAFLALSSLYLFVRYLRTESRATAAAYALVTILLVYTHPFALFVVAGESAFLGFEFLRGRIGDLRRAVGTQAALGLAVLPLVAGFVLRFGGGVTLDYIPLPTPLLVFTVLTGYFARTGILPALAYVSALIGGLLVLAVTDGCFSAAIDVRRPARTVRDLGERIEFTDAWGVHLLLFWIAGTFLLPLVVSYVVTPVFWPRYTLAASFALYLLVGHGLSRAKRSHVRIALVALLVVALLPPTVFDLTTDTREQWDEAVADIEQRADQGALVVVADQVTERAVEYYGTRGDLVVTPVNADNAPNGTERTSNAEIRRKMAGHEEVWLVLSHTGDEDDARLKAIASDGRQRTWHEEYVGIEVYRYEASPDGG